MFFNTHVFFVNPWIQVLVVVWQEHMAMTQGAVKAFILANWYRTVVDVADVLGLYAWRLREFSLWGWGCGSFSMVFLASTMGYISCICDMLRKTHEKSWPPTAVFNRYVQKLLPFAQILLKHSHLRWCIMYRKSRRKKLKTTVCFCLFPEQKPRPVPRKMTNCHAFWFSGPNPDCFTRIFHRTCPQKKHAWKSSSPSQDASGKGKFNPGSPT